MRELDELLSGYLLSAYDQAAESEKLAFRALLALPDPDLIGYLLGNQSPDDPELSDVIERIRSRTQTRP
jgi:succinate dehydrogenase flavin-adding protein (antitoxin of CptAB toxin-antitoxin module)